MGLVSKQWEFLKDIAKLIVKAEELGFHPAIDETKRCKDCPNTIKNSCHVFGLAADICLPMEGLILIQI